jgi:hypothetical protein
MYRMCVLTFSVKFEMFLFLATIQKNHIISAHRSSCKVPVMFDISIKLQFSQQTLEKYSKYQISRKSVQREVSCSMRIDGRT